MAKTLRAGRAVAPAALQHLHVKAFRTCRNQLRAVSCDRLRSRTEMQSGEGPGTSVETASASLVIYAERLASSRQGHATIANSGS